MPSLCVQIVRFVDLSQPGWVECRLLDAWDRDWTFMEKVPVVTRESLDATSDYPQEGFIACTVVRSWQDECGRALVTVDTLQPWGVAAVGGETQFEVLASRVVGQ